MVASPAFDPLRLDVATTRRSRPRARRWHPPQAAARGFPAGQKRRASVWFTTITGGAWLVSESANRAPSSGNPIVRK